MYRGYSGSGWTLVLWFWFVVLVGTGIWGGNHPVEGQENEDGSLPSIDKTVTPDSWLIAGPFSSGRHEEGIDPLANEGGFQHTEPETGMTHPGILTKDGTVSWRQVDAGEKGTVKIMGENVDWDTVASRKGAPVYIATYYLYADVTLDNACRAVAVAEEVGSFRINDRTYLGGFIGRDKVRVPVQLDEGKNNILLSVSTYRSENIKFRLRPVENNLQPVKNDLTLPDLRKKQTPDESFAGVPVANNTSRWHRNVTVRLSVNAGNGKKNLGRVEDVSIGPFAFRHVTVPLSFPDRIPKKWIRKKGVPVTVTVSSGEMMTSVKDKLPVRNPGEPRRVTFRSKVDGSVQYYSVRPPKNYDPDRQYALILGLHGANVKTQEKFIQRYSSKEWAFVVAPTNRGRFGFSWENQGRLNTMQTLDIALSRYPIDPDRVYLGGHSMGGHGVWVVGTAHADRFAAIGPGAGWLSTDVYTPYYMRKDHLFGSPRESAVLRAARRPDRPQNFLENLHDVPPMIVQGGADPVVPPFHARTFRKRLMQLGYPVEYVEVPGAKHTFKHRGERWLELKSLMSFFRGKKRTKNPEHLRFRTASPAENSRHYWVRVLQRHDMLADARLEASVQDKSTVRVHTSNVRKMTIDLSRGLPQIGDATVHIDDNKINGVERKNITLIHNESGWSTANGETDELQKTPSRSGPVRQVFYRPFLLVYATGGSSKWKQVTYGQARRFAQYWWQIGGGDARIVSDQNVTDAMMRRYNLVLLGNHRTNRVIGQINEKLPVRFTRNGIEVGGKKQTGDGIGIKVVYPNPEHPRRLVYVNGGLSVDGQRNALLPGLLSDELPDYLVLDENWKKTGFASVRVAGFFDATWSLSPAFQCRNKRFPDEK